MPWIQALIPAVLMTSFIGVMITVQKMAYEDQVDNIENKRKLHQELRYAYMKNLSDHRHSVELRLTKEKLEQVRRDVYK